MSGIDRVDLQIGRSERDDEVILACSGRLDAETCDELARVVAEELRRGHHAIRLDLERTAFLSSAGIRGLFETQRAAKAVGGTCLVRRASEVVQRVLDLTKLTPILMEPRHGAEAAARSAAPQPHDAAAQDVEAAGVRLLHLRRPEPRGLVGRVWGSPRDVLGGVSAGAPFAFRLSREAFTVGFGMLASGTTDTSRAGELAGFCGAVFQRPPLPHAAVDYLVPVGELRADVALLAGLTWEGLPTGRAGFEPVADDPAVRIDALIEAVLGQVASPGVALVIAGEIHGLVGAELIRPLAEARGADTPLAGERNVVASWLAFSREPVYPRHTAIVVGVATRDGRGPLEPVVRGVPGAGFSAHLHAVVFPFRPLRRGGLDLTATVDDLAASQPLAVLHLLADPRPVLGSGRSELVRGAVWFAPLDATRQEAAR